MAGTALVMLKNRWRQGKYVCVGLDTKFEKLPHHIHEEDGGTGSKIKNFNCEIILATRDTAVAYKYNFGFYLGRQRLVALEESVQFSKAAAPEVPIVLDWKAGDVGSTLQEYANYAFEELGVDAVTVNPWGGKKDGIDAFLKYKDKLVFIWCRGTNEGACEIQDMDRLHNEYSTSKIYESVAIRVGPLAKDTWNYNNNCGVVVGTTKDCTGEVAIREARRYVGNMAMLIPGVGEQQGDLAKAVRAAIYTNPESHEKSLPALINSSRGIIYASSGKDFAEAAREKTVELNNRILEMLEDEMVDDS